jgi:hypothetical protein
MECEPDLETQSAALQDEVDSSHRRGDPLSVWHPLESAPKDGRTLIFFSRGTFCWPRAGLWCRVSLRENGAIVGEGEYAWCYEWTGDPIHFGGLCVWWAEPPDAEAKVV